MRIARARGSLLVVTLWLIVALAAGAVALSSYLSTETRLMRYHIAKAQAKAWAEAGVVLALERLAEDAKPKRPLPGGTKTEYDWLGDEWAYFPEHVEDPSTWVVRLPTQPQPHVNLSGQLTIRIVDEDRKLNINRLKTQPADYKQVFQNLLSATQETVNVIVDYLDDDSNATRPGGIEHSDSPAYTAKNAAMNSLAELEGIPNLPKDPAFWKTLHNEVTVASVKTLNINTVSRPILIALGLDPKVVDAIDRHRIGTDGELLHEQDGVFDDPSTIVSTLKISSLSSADQAVLQKELEKWFGVTSSSFLITSEVALEAPAVTCRIEAIVRRGVVPHPSLTVAKEPFEIVAWSER